MPSALMRWTGPKECADELIDVFGIYWAQMLVIELSRAMGVTR